MTGYCEWRTFYPPRALNRAYSKVRDGVLMVLERMCLSDKECHASSRCALYEGPFLDQMKHQLGTIAGHLLGAES